MPDLTGWGFRVQIGRTHLYLRSWPFFWEVYSDLSSPRLYGLGFWITKDVRT